MTTPDKPAVPATGANQEIGLQIAGEHALIGRAGNLPVSAPTPVVSVSPLMLSAPGRIVDLQMRLTWTCLRSALYPEDPVWPAACAALEQMPDPLGKVDSK